MGREKTRDARWVARYRLRAGLAALPLELDGTPRPRRQAPTGEALSLSRLLAELKAAGFPLRGKALDLARDLYKRRRNQKKRKIQDRGTK